MNALTPTLVILSLAPAIASQAGDPSSPYPRFMPGYEFHGSLASAINAAGGKRKIVVYSVHTVALRDRLAWLMQQRAIFANAMTRRALKGIPIVAVRHDVGEAKILRVPKIGLSILSTDGKRVEVRIDFALVSYEKVPAVLAEIMTGKAPTEPSKVFDAQTELAAYRNQHAKMLNAIDAGEFVGADRICRSEEKRLPNGMGPRLLRQTLRARTLGPDYHKALPVDRPMRDVVCVVPDVATFLRTIEAWGDGPIFPILFLDGHYLPLFLAAFQAKQVLFVPKVRGGNIDVARVYRCYAKALAGGRATTEKDAVELWKGHQAHAPGVVFSHPRSRMLAAGVALAAGRRQLLAMMEPVQDPTKRVSFDAMARIRGDVQSLFRRNFLEAEQLYDDIDFVTLATEQPFRYYDPLAADKTTYAVDDAIARDAFELPQAWVGRLLGDREQSLYMAMCALFLTPRNPLLFSRYRNQGNWRAYGTKPAETLLKKSSLPVRHVEHPQATLQTWQDMFRAGPSTYDLVHVNSSGGRRNWSTSNGNGSFDDLPLTVPTIVSYVHSNSLGDGYDSDTVGGRWLHNGAYSFFGSTSEPYLDAFVNIYAVYRRSIVEGLPLGTAHRLLPQQLRWRPWKLMLFGDPMIQMRLKLRERQKQLPAIAGAIPVAEAAARNPFGLNGIEAQLFKLQCLALQGSRYDVALTAFLRRIRLEKTVTTATRRATADLVAWASLSTGGLPTLRRRISRLRTAGIQSRRLSYVAHALFRARVDAIAKNPSARGMGEELEQLALEHIGFEFSRVMYRRIGELYKPVLKSMRGGTRLRNRIKSEAKKRAKNPKVIQAFISAL